MNTNIAPKHWNEIIVGTSSPARLTYFSKRLHIEIGINHLRYRLPL